MERSLSALLPVHNAQSTLSGAVLELLDVLPDLTSRFEIVVVDDCSTDDTIEVADEMAACYPQVKAVRQSTRQGWLATVAVGVAYSVGEIVFLKDVACTVAGDEARRLWQAIHEYNVVLGQTTTTARWPWNSPRRLQQSQPDGLVMFHRGAFEPIRAHLMHGSELRKCLSENHLRWRDVEVRDRASAPLRARTRFGRDVRADHGRPNGPDRAGIGCNESRRPNYLDALRRFAVGE